MLRRLAQVHKGKTLGSNAGHGRSEQSDRIAVPRQP